MKSFDAHLYTGTIAGAYAFKKEKARLFILLCCTPVSANYSAEVGIVFLFLSVASLIELNIGS